MEYTTVYVRYNDAEGWECIEEVPFFDAISGRLSHLLSIGGEIIPDYE